MMELKEAMILFDAGGLKNARIMNDPTAAGWVIIFERKEDGKWINSVYSSRRSDGIKNFKDMRSAVNTVKKIGFNSVEITNLQMD